MIQTTSGHQIETYLALRAIVQALDDRFPDGNSIFQRVSRLTEECGELAAAINHKESMGIKRQKHGEPSNEHLVKELQDVLRATLGIARHYGLEDELEISIEKFYKAYQQDEYIK